MSIYYTTAVHLCACGCGSEVVTPLSPFDWKLLFNGETLSLTPSIGNWGFLCQSHYWIRNNGVYWARKWTIDEIRESRASAARVRLRGAQPTRDPKGTTGC